MKNLLPALFCCFAFSAIFGQPSPSDARIDQAELVRRTQEMFDAVAGGDQKPWNKYIADDAMYFDEQGHNMDKATLIKGLAPLPQGYAGTIHVVKPQSRIVGNTAILSFDCDETEIVFGQTLTARYHETDTWMYRNGQWQIIAGQVLRYYEDPTAGRAEASKFARYAGTYELGPGSTATVSSENGHLYVQRSGRAKQELVPEAGDIFFIHGVEGRRIFRYTDGGQVDAMIDRRNNQDLIWRKTN
jgi:hypothetical protein